MLPRALFAAFIIVLSPLLCLPNDVAYAQQIEASKLNGSAVLQSGGAMSSKLNAAGVLQNTAISGGKLNAGAVLQGTAVNAAKLSAYVVLQRIPGPANVLRSPLTHW